MTHDENDAVLDGLLARTPFHLPEGCGLALENRNAACSHAEIETLIQKGTVNPTDLEIMKSLAVFPFLNHHNLRHALSFRIGKEHQKESYADNLKKLKNAGILLCYRIQAQAIEETEDTPPASPLRLYALSQGAFSYMEKTLSYCVRPVSGSGLAMLRTAAASQFALRFSTQYPECVQKISLAKTVRSGKSAASIDALIRFFPPGGKPGDQDEVTLVLLSVREQDKWLEKEATRIRIVQEWLSHQTRECLSPVFVFCVEQISMALSLHAGISRRSLLLLWEKYYCPDSLLTAYPPLQALYRCEDTEEGGVRAIRIGA